MAIKVICDYCKKEIQLLKSGYTMLLAKEKLMTNKEAATIVANYIIGKTVNPESLKKALDILKNDKEFSKRLKELMRDSLIITRKN